MIYTHKQHFIAWLFLEVYSPEKLPDPRGQITSWFLNSDLSKNHVAWKQDRDREYWEMMALTTPTQLRCVCVRRGAVGLSNFGVCSHDCLCKGSLVERSRLGREATVYRPDLPCEVETPPQHLVPEQRVIFACSQKSIEVWMRFLRNNFEECFTVIFIKKSPIFIMSPKYFQLNRWENGKWNYSSEKHLRNPKTRRDFYLDLELFIGVKKFEFHLVNPVSFSHSIVQLYNVHMSKKRRVRFKYILTFQVNKLHIHSLITFAGQK